MNTLGPLPPEVPSTRPIYEFKVSIREIRPNNEKPSVSSAGLRVLFVDVERRVTTGQVHGEQGCVYGRLEQPPPLLSSGCPPEDT